jgi:tRNA threonylcarbamoyladenosine biosynthesis protein TsaB
MTRLLALETSSEVGSVALLAGTALGERTIERPREQTQAILPHVQALLAEAGVALADLDGIAFGRGPGSFTGLRVATAVAQGLGMAADLPLFPISSLAAIAQGLWRDHGIERSLVCVDARMGEVYWGRYAIRDALAALEGAEALGAPEDVRWAGPAPWSAVGSGFAVYASSLAVLARSAARVLSDVRPSAGDLLPLALDDLAHGRGSSVEDALPVYLRRASAWRR